MALAVEAAHRLTPSTESTTSLGLCNRLLHISPSLPLRVGEQLLQAHLEAELQLFEESRDVTSAGSSASGLNRGGLTIGKGDVKTLVKKCLDAAALALGEEVAEAFDLLWALFGCDLESSDHRAGKEAKQRKVILRLSHWLSQVNGRKVRHHLGEDRSRELSQAGSRLRLQGEEGPSVSKALEAAFHHLTANSVKGALDALAEVAAAGGPHFDRLGGVIAGCGGASVPSRDRRVWLRRQLEEWRRQGVPELMGPELWRLYSLLGGELDEVVADCLDWRTAFSLFLWYWTGDDKEKGLENRLGAVVKAFQRSVASYGSGCSFQPVPHHIAEKPRPRSSSPFGPVVEPPMVFDLQYSAILAAAGELDWQDLSHFDTSSFSSNPLEVPPAWHMAVLMSLLRGGDTEPRGFQQLTQQYCQQLELSGQTDWAIYVAHFIAESSARDRVVRGLLMRRAHNPSTELKKVPLSMQPRLQELYWRARAARSEQAEEWSVAVACWLKAGNAQERATTIACGFLLGPVILAHAVAPFRQGASEEIALAAMVQPARWLLAVFKELERTLRSSNELWAEVGRASLAFLREWAEGTRTSYERQELVRLHWRCGLLRDNMLGLSC